METKIVLQDIEKAYGKEKPVIENSLGYNR